MFLKEIQLQGFKSFAEKTTISFQHAMSGIVGPNGCGKSNINDAIRWVLGEQSVKALRGNQMSDVIFAGSSSKKAVNLAKVTLVFDNSKRFFDIDYDEVSISRCLYRKDGANQYFLNKSECRLKDIQLLIMDSGLGKDSLSIISQGNIAAFADSKPVERRGVFEEAAGVSKYKKRKLETQQKLLRTKENLARLEDIIYEVYHQLKPLESQKEKALIYQEKVKKLKELEICLIVSEVSFLEGKVEEINKSIHQIKEESLLLDLQSDKNEIQIETYRDKIQNLDIEVNSLQDKILSFQQKINQLEKRKAEIDERRKYMKEKGSSKEKIKQLQLEISELDYEIKHRTRRFEEIKSQVNHALHILEQLNNQQEKSKDKLNQLQYRLSYLNQQESLKKQIQEKPFMNNNAIKQILAIEHIDGIYDIVGRLIQPHEGYEKAIQASLQSIQYHIVVETSDVARGCIEYLKKNKAGRATFIPLNTVKRRNVDEQSMHLLENLEGFLAIMSDKVNVDSQFDLLVDSTLGNVILCDTIRNATHIAKAIKHRYKIVTLDGDIIHVGGIMSGGSNKQSESLFGVEKQLQEIKKEKNQVLVNLKQQQEKHQDIVGLIEDEQQKIMQLKIDYAQLQPIINVKKEKMKRLSDELQQYDVSTEKNEDFDDELVKEISNLYEENDLANSTIQLKRSQRMQTQKQLYVLEKQQSELRQKQQQVSKQQSELLVVSTKYQTTIEYHLQTLRNNYEMTYEYASSIQEKVDNFEDFKHTVTQLKKEIKNLGDVNLQAPLLFEELQNRYNELTSQKEELNQSSEDILNAIKKMDHIMIKQFREMFDKINEQLQIVFSSLFPNGKATLVLCDETNLLETGIDVNVSFPGKTLQNMRLFSGGEKALIAITVLFAIIQARTMPLCIFDEVEAALDQNNVDRFAQYISTLKNQTQFILVTHRPGTMVKCDELFGVTMQESGVSSLLSVKMEDALSYIK